jgi:hypothetical protein
MLSTFTTRKMQFQLPVQTILRLQETDDDLDVAVAFEKRPGEVPDAEGNVGFLVSNTGLPSC